MSDAEDAKSILEGLSYIVPIGTMSSKLILPVSLTFKPQPDITAYELARLLPLFWRAHQWALMPSDVPTEPELLRHLEVHDPNKERP